MLPLTLALLATTTASPAVPPWRAEPHGFEVRIAAPNEPGERFVIEGRVLDERDRPLADTKLYVYHADKSGRYPAAKEPRGYPRLAGTLRTDSLGHYRVVSVLPGQYEGPRHVHFEMRDGDRVVMAWFVNLQLEYDRRVDSRRTGRPSRVPEREPTPPFTRVMRDENGIWRARYDLYRRAPSPMDSPIERLRRR